VLKWRYRPCHRPVGPDGTANARARGGRRQRAVGRGRGAGQAGGGVGEGGGRVEGRGVGQQPRGGPGCGFGTLGWKRQCGGSAGPPRRAPGGRGRRRRGVRGFSGALLCLAPARGGHARPGTGDDSTQAGAGRAHAPRARNPVPRAPPGPRARGRDRPRHFGRRRPAAAAPAPLSPPGRLFSSGGDGSMACIALGPGGGGRRQHGARSARRTRRGPAARARAKGFRPLGRPRAPRTAGPRGSHSEGTHLGWWGRRAWGRPIARVASVCSEGRRGSQGARARSTHGAQHTIRGKVRGVDGRRGRRRRGRARALAGARGRKGRPARRARRRRAPLSGSSAGGVPPGVDTGSSGGLDTEPKGGGALGPAKMLVEGGRRQRGPAGPQITRRLSGIRLVSPRLVVSSSPRRRRGRRSHARACASSPRSCCGAGRGRTPYKRVAVAPRAAVSHGRACITGARPPQRAPSPAPGLPRRRPG
jgi:hypothetical protein